MRLYIGEVKKSVGRTFHDIEEENFPSLSWEGKKLPFAQPVRVDAILTNCGSEILVKGVVDTALVMSCSRCLEPSIQDIKAVFYLEYRNLSRIHRFSDIEAEASESDEVGYFWEEDNYIEVTREVEEVIFINLPMKPLCSPDCRGLCPVCGANRNKEKCFCEEAIDPRLAVLKNWAKENL